jgi:hypothetical protein
VIKSAWFSKSIKSDAAALRESVDRCFRLTLERREALDREGRADEPLTVFKGEEHEMPAHGLHHMMYLESLHNAGLHPFVGIEQPHDFLQARLAPVFLERDLTAADKAKLRALDKEGSLSIAMANWFGCGDASRHSQQTLMHFLTQTGIPVQFTDADWVYNDHDVILNEKDDSTALSLRACFNEASANIEATGRKGVYARNHHMAHALQAWASACDPRVIVQICGRGHITGMGRNPDQEMIVYPWIESLPALFKARALPTLSITPILKNEKSIPLPDHTLEAHEILVEAEWPEVDAWYPLDPGKTQKPVLKTVRAEARYLNRLMTQLGMEKYALSPKMAEQQKEACRNFVFTAFKNLNAAQRNLQP